MARLFEVEELAIAAMEDNGDEIVAITEPEDILRLRKESK